MILLTNATNFEINNEFWVVSKSIVHLPSVTQTAISNAGYGGIGIRLIINSQFFKHDELQATLFKNNSKYVYKSDVSRNNSCILVPNGGNLNEYNITIEQKPKHIFV